MDSSICRLTLIAGAVMGSLNLATACLWDRDTAASEATDVADAVAAITGRFDRFPPRYYEIRLERVTKELTTAPDDLSLYDDAAVACDRLGDAATALIWMEKKKKLLDRKDDITQRYRYLANTGTFYAHRWLRNGMQVDQLDDLQNARDFIRLALELNEDAHFGREKYQLMALDWIHEVKSDGLADWQEMRTYSPATFLGLDFTRDTTRDRGLLAESGLDDAIKGVSGLIVLGDAWQSPDVYFALATALAHEGRSSIAYLAALRTKELLDSGERSIVPASDYEEWLAMPFSIVPKIEQEKLRAWYITARPEADDRQKRREQWMHEQFASGLHPDTDGSFWTGFSETTMPPAWPRLEFTNWAQADYRRVVGIVGGCLVVGALVVVLFVRKLLVSLRKRTAAT